MVLQNPQIFLSLTITNKTKNILYLKEKDLVIQSNNGKYLGISTISHAVSDEKKEEWFRNTTNTIKKQYSNISIYNNTNRTNLIFKVTNIVPLIGEIDTWNIQHLKFHISITESIFTNTYYGTTNE